MSVINWRVEDKDTFERIVTMLVQRVHGTSGWDVQRPDGRGGDTGVDILATGPAGEYLVYQLKFFPEGLAFSNRKQQIQRSLKKAADNHSEMTGWVLVVPCSLTRGQTKWFTNLSAGASSAAFWFWDESKLDSLLADFPDVHAYARRNNDLFEQAKVFAQERAILANPAVDIPARLTAFNELANTIDPDYRVNMSIQDGVVELTAVPKHANATQHVVTKFAFPEGYERYLIEVLELINYGTAQELALPPQVIVSVERRGPAFLTVEPPDGSRQTLTFGTQAEPEPITLRILDEHGEPVGTHPGTVLITSGQLGVKLTAIFHDALHITWRIPLHETDEQPATQFTLSPEGHLPANVIASCRLLRQVLTCPQLDILVKGTSNRLTTRDPNGNVPTPTNIVQATAEDLEAVQRATETYFAYPGGLSDLDRAHLRVCRMLTEGRTALAPAPFTVQFELDAAPPPTSLAPGPLWLDGQQVAFQVGEHEIVLRDITIWHPAGWIKPTPNTAVGGPDYTLEPREERFILSPDGAAVHPEPWRVIDVTEPNVPAIPEGLFTDE